MRPPVTWAVMLVFAAISGGCGGGGGDDFRFTGTYEGTISDLGPRNQPASGSRRFRMTLKGGVSEYSILTGDQVVDSGTFPANTDVSCQNGLTLSCSGSLSGTVTSGGLTGCSISGAFAENGAALVGTFSCPRNQGAFFNVRRA